MRYIAAFCLILVLIPPTTPAGRAGNSASSLSGPSSDPSSQTPLILIILPVENVGLMYEKFLPLREYLEKAISRKIVLKIAQNYQEAIESIGTSQAHIAYLDPSAYCEARKKYGVIPLVKTVREGSSRYKSVIVARKDSAIQKIVDAKGKRLALGNMSSSSSSLIPAVMFNEVGITLRDFKSVDYLEHEDRIALSVLAGRHDIGGLSERVAVKYLGDGLKIIKTSEAIPQFSLCSYSGMQENTRMRIREALLAVGAHRDPELVNAMKDISGFEPADDRDFDVVRMMIKNLTGKNYLEYGKNDVRVAILPLYSAITLFERFDPLMRYLTKKTGREFRLVIPKDFEDFFSTVRQGSVDFSYSNPYIYIQLADRGYLRALANTVMQSSGDIFRGVIITHSDSSIRSLDDLRGKRVMVVSYRSAGGFLAQRLFLHERGIDVFRDLRLIEGKRQEEVILNVYRKNVEAGFVRESALEVLKEEIDLGKIRVISRTPYIANWPFAATKKADEKITLLTQKILLELTDEKVLSAADIARFKFADDRDYDTLRQWIRKHESE